MVAFSTVDYTPGSRQGGNVQVQRMPLLTTERCSQRVITFMLLVSVAVLAQTFTDNGIKYSVTSTDEMTVKVSGSYNNKIVIP